MIAEYWCSPLPLLLESDGVGAVLNELAVSFSSHLPLQNN